MNRDDDDDTLAPIDLHAWHVPPPPPLDRASLLARALAPAAAPRRARGSWLFAALAIGNVVLAAIILILLSQRPSPATMTVRPAGGAPSDPQTAQLLQRLEKEEHDLETQLAEIQQLEDKVRDCDQTVKHRITVTPLPPTPPTPTPVVPAPATPQTPEIAGCDEVSCVLQNYENGCCDKYKKVPPARQPPPANPTPESLDRTAISAGINAVKPQVAACTRQSTAKGKVRVHVRVAPTGKVTSVEVEVTPDAALGGCVAAAIQTATFGVTQQGGSFSYPFVF